MKAGDQVLIMKGPPDKVGLVGKITYLLGNGAMVQLGHDWFSPIQFSHMEQLYTCFKCQGLKREYEMSPVSQDVVNNNEVKLNHNICKVCEEELKQEAEKYVKNNLEGGK